jgi:hypothetical protein
MGQNKYKEEMAQTYIFVVHVKELVELNSTVREGTECTLLLEVGGQLRIGYFSLKRR